ncbi:MAG: Xylose isomerase domain protein barrel [Bryobacterales bacterium]|jgi:sugar phosphate isomerase/epimerase|nr:Xylose isomerase domain protein barrel [Bryobacterales bacterium]
MVLVSQTMCYRFGMNSLSMSRRTFVAMSGLGPLAFAAGKNIPVGLELFSVRDELMKDLPGTVRAVAKMGYPVVEFYAPYFSWTPAYAKDVRKLLDDLGIRCNSTHNNPASFTAEGLPKAIELNQIIGSKNIIMASAGRVEGIAGWKTLGEQMTKVSETLKPLGMGTGFHNHQTEWAPVEGKRPMDVLAANTPKEFTLQLDVGTVMEAGADPVAWITANPGRIRSIHCKDWAAGQGQDRGYRVLFGEGDSPWAKIFEAAESVGGVEYYLIEQEGSRFPALETAERCLATWKKMRA